MYRSHDNTTKIFKPKDSTLKISSYQRAWHTNINYN
jgi:hypothetical protein